MNHRSIGRLSAARDRGTFRAAGPSGPSIRRFVPVGALVHAAHRPSPACAWRCPAAATAPGRTRRSRPASNPQLSRRRQREHAPRNGRRGWRRRCSHRNLAISGRARCRRNRRCRSSNNRASRAVLSGRCLARRSFRRHRHRTCRRCPRLAVRRRQARTSRVSPGYRPRPPRRRSIWRRPLPIRPGRSRQTQQGPAVTIGRHQRLSDHPRRRAAVQQSSCPMAMAPARSYIRTARSRLSPHHAELPWPTSTPR